jgi:hypothetical protein
LSRGRLVIGLGFALLAAPGPAAAADPAVAQSAVPEDPVAAALTAALQTVHDRYAPAAKPVPDDVKQALAAEYGEESARARYVVSQLAISVLSAIDQFQGTSLRSGQHAMTVDDLIVFASTPTSSDLWMWAHELHHVRQYRMLGGVDAFAAAYLSDCEGIEKEADERANRALGKSIHPRHCL